MPLFPGFPLNEKLQPRFTGLDPFAGDVVPTTFAPAWAVSRRPYSKVDERTLRFWAENVRALVAYFRKLPDCYHDQGLFSTPANAMCGTRGCLLGWAAMGHVVDGLQFVMHPEKDNGRPTGLFDFDPTINGRKVGWDKAGRVFFGDMAMDRVFSDAYGNKSVMISRLLEVADQYEAFFDNPHAFSY